MEETVKIPKSIALSLLSQLEEHVKPQLAAFINPSIEKWEDIKSFDDVFKVKFKSGSNVLPIEVTDDEKQLLAYSGREKSMLAVVAFLKLSLVSKAMNCLANNGELWFPDWSNSDEYKYYPWLEYKAGSGFSVCGCRYGYAVTDVGSRLCFMTSDMARHAAVHFEALYNDLFTL